MAQLDLSPYRRALFAGRGMLATSDAPRMRFAYRGHRLAPISGLSRTWLLEALGAPPVASAPAEEELPLASPPAAPIDGEAAPEVTEAAVDQDAPTDVLNVVAVSETEVAEAADEPALPSEPPPREEPALEPVAATFVDALALQMWLVDALSAQGFRLERFTAEEREALEAASGELLELERRLTEIGATGNPPREVQGALRKLGRELSSLATFAEVAVTNVALALDTDATTVGRREPLALPEAPRPEKAREADRSRAERDARAAHPAPSRGDEAVRVGRLKVRFSPKEVGVLKVIAFGVMPLVVAAAIAFQYWRATGTTPDGGDAARVLSTLDGHAVGDAYVVEIPWWSDFDTDRARLLELTKSVAAAGYRSARFEHGGKTVAVWEQGRLRPGS
ncbi:MAG: hypothetical protein U0610_25190 [bacterium]